MSVHLVRGFDVAAKISSRCERRRIRHWCSLQREERETESQENAVWQREQRREDETAERVQREDVTVPHEEQMREADDQEEDESAHDVAIEAVDALALRLEADTKEEREQRYGFKLEPERHR